MPEYEDENHEQLTATNLYVYIYHAKRACLPVLTANSSPEDLSGGAEMERSTQRLDVASQAQELQILELVAVEVARHLDALGADNHHFVTVQQELGRDGGQTAQQMAATIDHHWLQTARNGFKNKTNRGPLIPGPR